MEAFALSLGLASVPNLDFLKDVKNREGLRDSKNVNRKLQKLKEQIRLEKEKKKKKKEDSKKRKPSDHDEDSEDDLLVVKARHEYSQDNTSKEDELRSGSDRHPKKIRIDGGNSQKNLHTKFNEDGTVQPKMLQAAESDSDDEPLDTGAVEQANESYMEQVLQRLEQTRDLDKKDERERIRAKHKKQKLQERAEKASPDEEGEDSNNRFTLSTDGADSSSSSSSDDDDSSDSESSSSSEDEDLDVTAQEDIALSLIRGNA